MGFSYNRVTIGGNLVRDPEIRYVSNGKAVTKFTIAVNRGRKGEETTSFVDCVAWEKLAETVNTYWTKGKPILVDGELVIRQYEDKGGEKRKATEIVVNRAHFLPDGQKNGNAGNGGGSGRGAEHHDEADDELGSEIPF